MSGYLSMIYKTKKGIWIWSNHRWYTSKALSYLVNCCISKQYVPSIWKVAEVIMIIKPEKQSTMVNSYESIFLLPVPSKLFKKGFLTGLWNNLWKKKL